jgi:photosystem II stability/assembly factor-like uncharacterized protein
MKVRMKNLIVMARLLLMYLIISTNLSFAQQWQKINPPLHVPTVYFYTVTSNGTEFIGTEGGGPFTHEICGGIFRSTNNGQNWELKSNGINSFRINYIAEAPNGWLYAGTLYGSMPGTIGCLYRSRNNGDSWELMINYDPEIYDIKFNSLGYIFAGSQYGMYISTDNGTHWSLRNNGLQNYNILSLLVISDTILCAATNNGFHITTDFGLTWTPRDSGLIKWADNYMTSRLILKGNRIYLSCYNGIFYSDNLGISWTPVAQIDHIKNLEIDTNNVFYLYSDYGFKILTSTDNGITWTSPYSFPKYLEYYHVVNNKVYASVTSRGLWVSDDTARTFNIFFNESYVPIRNSKLVINKGTWYAGSTENGLFISTDMGLNWKIAGPTQEIIGNICINKAGEIFVNCGNKIYRSNDEGKSWSLVPPPENIPVEEYWTSCIQLSMSDKLYASFYLNGGCGIYRLDDDSTWTKVIHELAIVDNMIFDDSEDVYLTLGILNGSSGWSYETVKRSNNFTLENVLFYKYCNLAINDSGHVFFVFQNNIYVTKDRGASLININNNIGSFNPNCLNTFSGYGLYIGGSNKIIFSTDEGNSWSHISCSNYNINSIQRVDNYIIVDGDDGIFKLDLLTLDVIDPVSSIPRNYSLSQNYPNPFNPSTKIKYAIAGRQMVSLKVYDLLGNEIKTLVNELKQPGVYEVTFDGSRLSSGIYFYKLQSGSFTQTRKFILLK